MTHTLPLREVTLEQWARLPEDEAGEVVDGLLTEEEVPSAIHELAVAWLLTVLHIWGEQHGALVFGSGIKLKVAPRSGRLPDLVVYLPGAKPPAPRGLVVTTPSIVVEVVSETPRDERRDRIEKLKEYAAAGIRWYWLVEPEQRSFSILELDAGRYAYAAAVTDGVIEEVPGCPELRIDVSAMWGRIDRLLAMSREE